MRHLCVSLVLFVAGFCLAPSALAQQVVSLDVPRPATFAWDQGRRGLFVDLSFRDIIDSETRAKLTRGLPTELLFTALVYTAGRKTPVSTTYQSCKITWHVWEEMYRVEITRANQRNVQRHWTPSINGVLRRCAEVRKLLVADSGQMPPGAPVYLAATVRINPVSAELLAKLKRWVSRPNQTSTAAPGSALFSTFTGLFMQRIGDAERTIVFNTTAASPN